MRGPGRGRATLGAGRGGGARDRPPVAAAGPASSGCPGAAVRPFRPGTPRGGQAVASDRAGRFGSGLGAV